MKIMEIHQLAKCNSMELHGTPLASFWCDPVPPCIAHGPLRACNFMQSHGFLKP